ncbi:MAG: hypothetical protein IPP72_15295 [Chitinophagaceae bacterium]|nr:hypothetical protein [Chitinophagaceae bacterium]
MGSNDYSNRWWRIFCSKQYQIALLIPWTSAANNGNWNDASNWCNAVVPTGATDAIIPTDATPYLH